MPWYTGRLASGMTLTMITMAPFIMPAAPKPDIARPMMKAFDVGAAPHMTDPISKMKMMARKTRLGE